MAEDCCPGGCSPTCACATGAPAPVHTEGELRRTVLTVAGLNGAYMIVEMTIALLIGSVSLFADSVDFGEDLAVNLLIWLALGWSLRRRATMGKIMAAIICVPAVAAIWQGIAKFSHPEAPDVVSLVLTAGGAVVVNSICAWLLARYRNQAGSMSKAAFLAARNDVLVNAAIIVMGVVTFFWRSGWPDIVLGLIVAVVNLSAAKEVWEVAEEEKLAAEALAGEQVGCC